MDTSKISREKQQLLEMTDAQVRQVLRLAKQGQQVQRVTSTAAPAKPAARQQTGLAQMEALIGLDSAKAMVYKMLAFQKLNREAVRRGKPSALESNHMAFLGNPGTAKTTFARILARIFYEQGLLPKDNLVEVGRSELCGEYVGSTAIRTKEAVKRALGGVLFVDEAYSLVSTCEKDYGREAIDTLVQEMENHRQDLVVVLAGYPNEMENLLQSNAGLRSRVPWVLHFADYTRPQLCAIAEKMAADAGYSLTPAAVEKIGDICNRVMGDKDFGGGRFVRNLMQEGRYNKALALESTNLKTLSDQVLFQLDADLFAQPEGLRREQKTTLGFAI